MPVTTPKFRGAIPGRHLGRLKPPQKMLAHVIPLAPFLKRYGAKPPPDSVDYTKQAPNALRAMLANDQWGDCTIAATLHGITTARAVVPGGGDKAASDAEAVNQYHQICGRGDPGCYIPAVMEYLRDKGITAAGRLAKSDGYAALKLGDQLMAKMVVYLLGGLHLGINLPREWYQDADNGSVWDVTSSDVVGGHSIQAVGYNAQGLLISTWGKVVTLTWAAYSDRRWVEEAYAILHQDWYTKEGLDAHGLNVEALKKALDAVKGGQEPEIPDTPPEPPPPGPGPGPGQMQLHGSLEVFGQKFPIELTGDCSGAMGKSSVTAPNLPWLLIIKDVAAIVGDLGRKDWVSVIADVEQLLGDLGLQFSPADRAALLDAMHSAEQTRPLTEEGPPQGEQEDNSTSEGEE